MKTFFFFPPFDSSTFSLFSISISTEEETTFETVKGEMKKLSA